ncbi:MAG: malectin domain-containing carbohydrate-binding protein, partial [Myxococcota bacterium]
AEIWSGAFNPGQRVFDVQVEGQLVFDNLDVVTEAGAPLTAHIIDVTTTVADGSLTITTVPVVQNPKLSAFSVWHVTAPPPTPTPPPSSTPATTAFSDPTVQGLIDTTDAVSGTGGALLTITPGNNVQKSNYGNNSFSLTNTGTKRIAAVYLDVSTALFSDVVFDGDGTGGDSVAKVLTYNSGGGTVGAIGQGSYNWLWQPARGGSFVANAAFSSSALTDVDNLFVDATSNSGKPSPAAGGGFRGELLLFTGFDATETVGFSGDMDPNSIAGLTKNSVDSGSNQAGTNSNFDVGGVSGAEMVGSIVTVLFGDGTTATGMLAHDGTQSGAVAVIGANAAAPGLTVNGVSPGGTGTYGGTRPTIVATGPPGDVVRVTMVKAFDPTGNTSSTVATGAITVDALVEARLLAQYPDFPVNNAVQWQHVDVTIPSGGSVDLTQNAAFDYVNINNVGGANDFTDDDILPIAFVAVTVDAQGQPLGDTSAPIRLINAGGPVP